ncbi:MAG: hypothetical protein JSW39_10075 [Desulfobacterales bacterium]|nr:MAG: hypothetical protein JSW39_10075 [Desulfobacterales bacterium]
MRGYIIQQEVGGMTTAKKKTSLRKRSGIYYFRKVQNGRPICFSLGTHLLTEAKPLKAQIEEFYRSCGCYPLKLAALKQPNQEEVPAVPQISRHTMKQIGLKRNRRGVYAKKVRFRIQVRGGSDGLRAWG